MDSGTFLTPGTLRTAGTPVPIGVYRTRSTLRTDQRYASGGSQREGLVVNDDASVDLYFGPAAPEGMESNWVQTVPGKGFNVILRLHGPLDAWFDKTWRPGASYPPTRPSPTTFAPTASSSSLRTLPRPLCAGRPTGRSTEQ